MKLTIKVQANGLYHLEYGGCTYANLDKEFATSQMQQAGATEKLIAATLRILGEEPSTRVSFMVRPA
jgi:hypothetical protein